MDAHKSVIFVFQLVKPILQTITHLIQYTVLEIQFWSVKCVTATVQYSEISSISIPSHQAFSSSNTSNKPVQNTFKRIEHYIYLSKLYGIVYRLFYCLKITNICSKIRTIGMNLWMVYLYLQYEKLWKVWKMGRMWMCFASLTEIMRDLWLD